MSPGSPPIQGAVLAELTSIWLAGHYQFGDEAIRVMFEMHLAMVRRLVPVNVGILRRGKRVS